MFFGKIGTIRRMRGGMKFRQGDIILIPFPYSDLTGAKRRPALIISNSNLKGNDKVCCLVTSNKISDGVLIGDKDFEEGKLPFKSFVKSHRIFCVDERIIIKKLARVGKKFHGKIKSDIDSFIR